MNTQTSLKMILASRIDETTLKEEHKSGDGKSR